MQANERGLLRIGLQARFQRSQSCFIEMPTLPAGHIGIKKDQVPTADTGVLNDMYIIPRQYFCHEGGIVVISRDTIHRRFDLGQIATQQMISGGGWVMHQIPGDDYRIGRPVISAGQAHHLPKGGEGIDAIQMLIAGGKYMGVGELNDPEVIPLVHKAFSVAITCRKIGGHIA